MRLLQILRLCTLLLVLSSPAISSAAPPSGQVYGPVSPKETLSEIAQKVRGEWRIPLKYVVQAMYEMNPQAFSDSGIDGLYIGSLLIVPDMKILSTEVPELLPDIPKPPASTPTAAVDLQQTQKLRASLNEQVNVIDQLVSHNQYNIDALKKLISKINIYQQRNRDLRNKLDTLGQQQAADNRQISALQNEIESLKAASSKAAPEGAPVEPGPPDYYLILLLIPTLLSLIAILMARRPDAQLSKEEPLPLPEPLPDFNEFKPAKRTANKPVSKEKDDTSPGTDERQNIDNKEPEQITGTGKSEESPQSAAHDDTTKGEPETTDANVIADTSDDIPTNIPLERETVDEVDIGDEALDLEIADDFLLEKEETADQGNLVPDNASQDISLTKADIEDKISTAYLHIDMGNSEQAMKVLDEINMELFPEFADKVNEVRRILEHPAEQLQEPQEAEPQPEPLSIEPEEAESQPETLSIEPEETTQQAETPDIAPQEAAPQKTAQNRVLAHQIKLANSYFRKGDMPKCKAYLAKILKIGIPEYNQQALALLKRVEDKQYHDLHASSTDNELGEDFDKTLMISPGTNPVESNTLELSGYHDLIPQDIYGRFIAYADSEEGNNLALAYLFLDIDETDSARQLLEGVLASNDSQLAGRAHRLLEMLIVP
ncbi:MAG: hypothetical protein OQL16_11975 [Gammaproteobacteria bacterium]|nr:hypothetical protein [Gammaproteobacteria bacterium]